MGGLQIDTKAIDQVFSAVDGTGQPGCAVGIAVGGVPVYRRGFGMASVELPVALTPSIRMRIGSTTKHFACLAFLLLVEDGKALPTDPVRKFVPELSAVAENVTMAQLMQHTSGLRCALDLNLQLGGFGRIVPTDDAIQLMAAQDSVNFAPGDSWSYNNGGYMLLTAAIERISGQSLETILAERIFAPAGMHDTLLRRVDTDMVQNSASLHLPTEAGGWTRGVFPAEVGGEGGIVSTVDDMLRWLKHMDAPVVGKPETWEAMKQSALLNNGHATGYGYGLFSGTYRGTRVLHHAGGVIGGTSQMLKVPDHGLDIIIIANRPLDSSGLAERIVDAVVPDLAPAREKPAQPVSGTWFDRDTGLLVQLSEKDGTQLMDALTTPIPALANDDGTLSSMVSIFDLRVRPLPDGRLEASTYGRTSTLDRLEAGDADAAAPTGTFTCPTVQVQATIARDGEETVMATQTRYGSTRFRLHAIGGGVWKATNVAGMPQLGGAIEFLDGGKAFLFTSGRTNRLRFERT